MNDTRKAMKYLELAELEEYHTDRVEMLLMAQTVIQNYIDKINEAKNYLR